MNPNSEHDPLPEQQRNATAAVCGGLEDAENRVWATRRRVTAEAAVGSSSKEGRSDGAL